MGFENKRKPKSDIKLQKIYAKKYLLRKSDRYFKPLTMF